MYNSIIALGLGACNAATKDNNDGQHPSYFGGQKHFEAMTRTTFIGASGPVLLNPESGSRVI